MKRQFQFDYLTGQGLKPGHRLMDIGCGTLRGGIPLIEYLEPGHYTGLEVRAEVLEQGRQELREAGLEDQQPVLLHSPDLDAIQLEHPVDFAWAFAVMIHMPDEVLDRCLAMVARSLAPGGVFLGNINLGDKPIGDWQGFPVMAHPMEWFVELAAKHGLAVEDLGSLMELGHDDGRPNPQTRRMLRFTLAGV